ncbi:MAG: hypothetical protein QM805_16285 [Pseudomonas sp.]
MNIGNNSIIESTGARAHAVFANKGGVINLGDTQIGAAQATSYGIYAETSATGLGNRGGEVNLLGNTQVTVADGGRAMAASGEGSSIVSTRPMSTGSIAAPKPRSRIARACRCMRKKPVSST